jgi:hypothetical protein
MAVHSGFGEIAVLVDKRLSTSKFWLPFFSSKILLSAITNGPRKAKCKTVD